MSVAPPTKTLTRKGANHLSSPRKKESYKKVSARAVEGDLSQLVDPLDFLLLEELPDEGTTVGGLYQVGESVQSLAKKFTQRSGVDLTTTLIASRMVSLKYHGLSRGVKMLGRNRGGNAWQRTVFGKEVAEEWRRNHPPE